MTLIAVMSGNLLQASSHFRFGENWARYSELVDESRTAAACESVKALVGDLRGKSFLDIGSGSGLFSVAALRLGAKSVVAIDIDPESVATTRQLLSREGATTWRAEEGSVFDLPSSTSERFDVVYSWGVLHHTGDMWKAIASAIEMVNQYGILAISLYERTPLCGSWTVEKRAYRKLPAIAQKLCRAVYIGVWSAGMLAKGHNPITYINGNKERGMDFAHDVHDWMGGYPYESTTVPQMNQFMHEHGFDQVKVVPWRVRLGGVLGTGCTEYVFRRR